MKRFAWVPRPFATWTAFAEYLAFLFAVMGDIGEMPWWSAIVLPSLLLLLLSWPRWHALVVKAGKVDAGYRELGMVWWRRKVDDMALAMFAKSYHLPFVLAVKVGHDCLHLTLAFAFGHVIRRVWFG